MYMLRAKPWARTRGVEEHTSLEHIVGRSGVHTYMEECVHCSYRAHCAHTEVEIVVVWSSDGADVVVSLGRGSETGCSEQLNEQIYKDEVFRKRVKLLFFVGEAADQRHCGGIKMKNLKVPIKSSIPVMV